MTWLVRLWAGALAKLAVATLVLYLLVVYTPGGLQSAVDDYMYHLRLMDCLECTSLGEHTIGYINNYFATNKPFPSNYLHWLTGVGDGENQAHGILKGDLGYSLNVARGEPVVDMLGEEPWKWPLAILAALFGLSVWAAARRRRGVHYYRTRGLGEIEAGPGTNELPYGYWL